jgi:hypothetical protein
MITELFANNLSQKNLVRSAGVEPATTTFVVWYSIQLSYDRTRTKLVFFFLHVDKYLKIKYLSTYEYTRSLVTIPERSTRNPK